MPLGTLDRSPPPIFRQGPSALSKLVFFSALAVFLMVADSRFRVTQPVRAALATALHPIQWLALQPVQLLRSGTEYFMTLNHAQTATQEAGKKLAAQLQRSAQVELLAQENVRLRKLLELRLQITSPQIAAEVLYDAADPYTRKAIIDKGALQGIALGSPVVDESGVLGQVTLVYPLVSEVTLVIDRELAIPVLNVRSGERSISYGEPSSYGGGLELRFMSSNADVQEGDLLTTSGVDGVYPAGLPVAKIARIERRVESAFAKIHCTPLARVLGVRHVMVIEPQTAILPARPPAAPLDSIVKRGSRK